MTISYNWLSEYLPEIIDVERLSKILTSIGLEVESVEAYENVKGGLKGLLIGEVITCEQHPNADKLKITTVNIGLEAPIQVVCGAANVATGQKVVVATVGATIYPTVGEPLTMKVAKIRGVESFGMICAEDEIGLGTSHEGILVLPNEAVVGTDAATYFKLYQDWIFEIGLTPNRMDAMSHIGVAKDVCAYLSHHNNKDTRVKLPSTNSFKVDKLAVSPITVSVAAADACLRYAGVCIEGVEVKQSPQWLINKLTAIGVRSINNIVDITNYILHEFGQPLHAFNMKEIAGNQVIVRAATNDEPFLTLDGKLRKLHSSNLVIADTEKPMCIAGVFGGQHSGVTNATTSIFLESACFFPTSVRVTSVQHSLRTDAATRFEKGVDISTTVQALKRAALLIKELAGGEIVGDLIDIYPTPKTKVEVALKNHYLKKLSGKNYHADAVKRILTALGFEIIKEGLDELRVAVPFSKPDIMLQADIVEEILRIDGLDNIEIPQNINLSPAKETVHFKDALKEKVANYLVGLGFSEILTNSITNSKYFSNEVLATTVKMKNNLSVELDVLRPSMLPTGLEIISHNINRKNTDLQLFELGKAYTVSAQGTYTEAEQICIYITGNKLQANWQQAATNFSLIDAKGLAQSVLTLLGIANHQFIAIDNQYFSIQMGEQAIGLVQAVSATTLSTFSIKQPVFYIELAVDIVEKLAKANKIQFKEVPKFPAVQRDLALVLHRNIAFAQVQQVIDSVKLPKLIKSKLFDVFEGEKLGEAKKSMAINFTFLDAEKTMTDKEIDAMMLKLITSFEKELHAEIRK